MKRNGFEQLLTNGRSAFDISDKRNVVGNRCKRHNGESHVARKIEQSISYMLEHLAQPLQVATLAATVNFSPSHYSALFKRWTGCAPIDYFIHLRMKHACWLFDNTPLNVKEVAAALGYDDPFYFSRVFKSVNQLAPTEYRQKSTYKPRGDLDSAIYLPTTRQKEFSNVSGSNENQLQNTANKTP